MRLAIDNPNDEGVLGYLAIMLRVVDRPVLSKQVTAQQAKLAPRPPLPWTGMVELELLYGSVAGLRRLLEQGARMGFVLTTYSGQLAIAERDSAALESVITDAVMPPTGPELVFPALKAYLDGEFERAAELVKPLKKPRGYQSYLQKWRIALVEQDLDAAMEAYRMAILNAEPLAITLKHGLLGYRTLFPEFYEHPQYEAMLSDFGLDARSLADIRIPNLSF